MVGRHRRKIWHLVALAAAVAVGWWATNGTFGASSVTDNVPDVGDGFTAQVVKAVDGDTVDVSSTARGRLRLRIAGIDTPKPSNPTTASAAAGRKLPITPKPFYLKVVRSKSSSTPWRCPRQVRPNRSRDHLGRWPQLRRRSSPRRTRPRLRLQPPAQHLGATNQCRRNRSQNRRPRNLGRPMLRQHRIRALA